MLCTGAAGNEAQQVQDELQQIEDDRAAQSDEYPVFQLIPKEMLVGKGKGLRLLPNDMGRWHTKVSNTCALTELHCHMHLLQKPNVSYSKFDLAFQSS